jgi:plastocyanin
MKTKMMSLRKKLSIVKALSTIEVLVLALGMISTIFIPASAQDSNTTRISIVSGAFRLTDTAYQPNPINIKVGDSVMWTNDDSSTHTVTTLRDQPATTDDDRTDDNNSDLGLVQKIRDELVSNIIINIRNALSDLGATGQATETTDISPSQQSSPASSNEFDSGIMQRGQTFKHTFYEAGTFEYYCTVHPAMVGKIVVS